MKQQITFILFLVVICGSISLAQPGFLLHNFREIPQNNLLNPGAMPHTMLNIGIPGISNLYAGFSNSGFRYRDVMQWQGDSMYANLANVYEKVYEQNFITMDVTADLLFFGIELKDSNYFTFNITERLESRFKYPKDFFDLAVKGNGSFVGEELLFDFAMDAAHYREHSIGYTHQFSPHFSWGIRGKYLYGYENVNTNRTNLTLYTDPYMYDLTVKSDLEYTMSGLDSTSLSQIGTKNYLFGRKNHGWAMDIGFDWIINHRFDISGSIIDFGQIKWKNGTQMLQNANDYNEYQFTGINLNDYLSNTDQRDALDEIADTLMQTFNVELVDTEPYSTGVYTKFYVGGDVHIGNGMEAGVNLFGSMFAGKLRPALNLWHASRTGKSTEFMISYTLYAQSASIFGIGWKVNLGPVQYYLLMDNLLGTIFPQSTKYANIRTGINLTFKPIEQIDPHKLHDSHPEHPDYDEYEEKKKNKKKKKGESAPSIE